MALAGQRPRGLARCRLATRAHELVEHMHSAGNDLAPVKTAHQPACMHAYIRINKQYRHADRTIDKTHGKHAELRKQINGQVPHHFLLVKQSKTQGKKSTGVWRGQREEL